MTDRMGTVSLNQKRSLNKKMTFDKAGILIGILGFFISRTSVINGLTPFGISFLAASSFSNFSFISFLSVIIGILSFHGIKGYNYLITMGIIYAVFSINNKDKKISIIKVSLISSIIFISVNFLKLILLSEYYIYDFMMVVFEGVVIFTLSYIFSYSFPQKIIEKNKFTNEELICFFITFSLALSGLGDLSLLGVSIKNIISILFIIVIGHAYGAALGSGIGITVGMVAYLSQPDMPFLISIYGLSGLFSGVFKDLGKTGSVLGFILGNSIMSFYINGFGTSFLSYYELGIGSLIFVLGFNYIEDNILNKLSINLGVNKSNPYDDRIKELTNRRLKEVSEVFEELSKMFVKVSEDKEVCTDNVSVFIDEVASDMCKNCSMNKFCWQDDFYTTYYSMFNLITMMEMTGEIDEEHIPKLFKSTCINTEKIMDKVYRLFDIYKINYIWEKKMSENRKLVAEQLNGISDIIGNLMKNIDREITFNKDVEAEIYSALRTNSVDVLETVVAEYGENDFEIYVEVDKCFKKANSLENVKFIVSQAIDLPLKGEFTMNSSQSVKERNRYNFKKANRYGTITKISKNSQLPNYVSGDSYTFGETEDNYFVALSDGMGIGKKANYESSIAISLLEKFLEAGFSEEVALNTINSILMLKSEEEIFTTLDISTIDLYSGKLQAIKTGAASTFIKKKDRVEVINSHSLPVGMLKDVDFQVYEHFLEDGDFIIMMSDGVLEANEEVANKEKWMREVIKNIDSFNPQTIANMVMKEAKKASKGEIKDDMTVLATKVWKVKQ
ncbi:stage II sporulation protein E [Anaerosalibacter bizertensis]|uniref:Stage II sporulation protein E n=1 Tax=Anaerosalibacter bizertensis TaxID=932217 RepID=A0A9Q4FL18_9FIRM|nr:stage II sporulation protein E [Anaerosalibacter bizertensis]MBV1817025.1 stage II sporulation protein E [Bacteroidales bacterium MSK.15.36]MCB5558876.1 stage II sporulation protein E [Anaerosalibacter bizertensis]MCG4565251.1 stage II sporulation protein E [Anaerosalibacter bizertensis]MCG4582091.1 stage II sporulation protein E [Anaerosalibacter bizertensis]